MSFIERRAPIVIIAATFALVVVPLTLLSLIPNFYPYLPHLLLAEGVVLGTTHFFITLAVYLHAENRAYFASSTRNKLIFFVAPCVIFAFMALTEATLWREQYPSVAAYLFAALRFMDFFHVGRQSVGMLQLWKRASHVALPTSLRRAENVFFVGLAALQWLTYARGGRFDPSSKYALLPAIALSLLCAMIVAVYARALLRREDVLRPGCYFLLQASCAASAAYETRLYLISLALHYVEYHVVMQPRCFYGKLDPTRTIDRVAAFLRSRPFYFYALLGLIVIAFELRNYAPASMPTSTRFFVHLFDGIFLVHYVIEAFLWKFGDPFYKATLAPLYFGPWPPSRPTRSARGFGPGLWCAGVLVVGLIAIPSADRRAALARMESQMIDPMRAEQHLRWGIELAQRGELVAARSHLLEAEKRGDDPRTKRALEWVDRRLRPDPK